MLAPLPLLPLPPHFPQCRRILRRRQIRSFSRDPEKQQKWVKLNLGGDSIELTHQIRFERVQLGLAVVAQINVEQRLLDHTLAGPRIVLLALLRTLARQQCLLGVWRHQVVQL